MGNPKSKFSLRFALKRLPATLIFSQKQTTVSKEHAQRFETVATDASSYAAATKHRTERPKQTHNRAESRQRELDSRRTWTVGLAVPPGMI
jgi:hypothetical protein